MDRKELVELTNKVYKQTLLFPKKEPLKYKIREVADDILAGVVEWEVLHNPNRGNLSRSSEEKDLIFKLENNLTLIKSYFNVIKWQNWISYFDVIKIEAEYDGLEGSFKPTEVKELVVKKPVVKKKEPKKTVDLDERKKKILSILKKKEKVQVWEVKEILSDVSKRTLRRDFDNLLKLGLVERIGESNNTFYKIVQ